MKEEKRLKDFHADIELEDSDFFEKLKADRDFFSNRELLRFLRLSFEGKTDFKNEAKENSEIESIETDDNHDFGANACPFRKPHDATNYKCFNPRPLVRVLHDGVVPKDICRICEHEKLIQRISTGEPINQSGKLYRDYTINDRERKRQERLEFLEKKERIKTDALEERAKFKRLNQSRVSVNYGDSVGVDPFY